MNLDVEISKDGHRILLVNIDGNKKYLGNQYNQKREIEKFINDINNKTEKDNYIVFGLFFGEHIQALLKIISHNSHILIIEHNQDIIDFCKNDKEAQQILNNSQVSIASSCSDIEEFFKQYIDETNVANLKIEEYCSYYNFYKDCLCDKYELIKKEITRITLNRNTVLESFDIVFDNFLHNLKYLAKSTPINKLKDKYQGIPAVIVSAGPSLSKNVDCLKKNGRRLVLSGGRTLRTLIEKNIVPNCVASVDFSDDAFKLVDGYLNKVDVPLVVSDKTNPKILEEHKGNKFFFSSNNFLNEILKEEIKELFGGGSIAHALTLFAIYMGCDPIVFIGQDLAYTGNREHDVLAESTWKKLTMADVYKNNSDLYVEDINGNPVRTSVQLNDYRFSLEKIIKENPNTRFINATEGGANIRGAVIEQFKDVVEEFQEGCVESLNSYADNVDRTQEIIRNLQEANKSIKQYISLCNEGIELSKVWRINYNKKDILMIRKCEEQLRRLDKKFNSNLKSVTVINSMLIKVAYNIENNKKFVINSSDNFEVKLNKQIDKIYEVYSQMRDVFEIAHKKIENTINFTFRI